jgi:hypothetical protein
VETQAVYRVCDKIRLPLTTLAGAAGFRSLLARSLTLAKQQSPVVGEWQIGPDGALQSLNGKIDESGAVLITQLIGLMITLIGESVTLRLLHDVWLDLPDAKVSWKGTNQNERTDQG